MIKPRNQIPFFLFKKNQPACLKNREKKHLFVRNAFLHVSFIFLIAFSSGCNNSNKPEVLIDEDKYIDLLVELFLLSAIMEKKDSSKEYEELQDVILLHYGITREQFQESHLYYHQDMRKQNKRFEIVRQRLENMSQKLIERTEEKEDQEIIFQDSTSFGPD